MRPVLVLLLWAMLAAPALARDVRVGLLRYQPPASLLVFADGPWQARAAGRSLAFSGQEARVEARGQRVHLQAGARSLDGPALELRAAGPFRLVAGGAVRRVLGELVITSRGGRLQPVLTLPLEAYVEAVTGDEMPADWPPAALEAQALAVRSAAVARLGNHRAEGYDFCDLTHCQLFHGLASRDARVSAAAARSRGQILAYHGRAIAALWHSTCAGRTCPNDEVFGGQPLPYLQGGPDLRPDRSPWCKASPHARGWRHTYERAALARLLPGLGRPAVADAAADGYPLAIHGAGPTMTGYELWMLLGPHLGWGEIGCPRFTLASTKTTVTIAGRGLGHLVGMCQWGARGRAEAGQRADAILRAYYPGAAPQRLAL